MRFLSLLIGKTILKLLRLMGRSGSALPGLVIEKINPGFLSSMLSQLPQGVVVISGTNGKTTTTKVTTALLEAHGLRVLTNKSGSNFVRGTVTTVIDHAKLSGKLPYDVAVFEQDEAHAVHFVKHVKPVGVVALNIMRDQMDRFGEIDTTAKYLKKVAAEATGWLVLNANDERISKLAEGVSVPVHWFAHAETLQNSFLTDDQLHHGDNTAYSLTGEPYASLINFSKDAVEIRVGQEGHMFEYPLSGSHNAINLTAALTVLHAVKPDADMTLTVAAVKTLQPAFGRGETITLKDGSTVTLQLVKNPGGFTHALRTLSLAPYTVAAVAINDDYADGRDVSWLWDVDFGLLEGKDITVLCGGVRGYDMAVRFKYDGVEVKDTHIDLSTFVKKINEEVVSGDAIIFCTYTAMLRIRAEYKKYSHDVYGVSV